MTDRIATIHRAVLVAFGTTVLSTSLPIMMAGAADLEDDSLQEVVITGSRVLRTDAETSSPVQIIDREEIEQSGRQNISEIIRNVSADNQGSIPTAFSGGFAAGSSAVSLRGLGVNSTLVLVNGRRMATYGLADDGSRTFVDLNSIPLEAVERVEVLKDGASAIYGSDAVAGVVNIILRENYQGASLGGSLGTSNYNDGDHQGINGSWGTGDIASDRYNIFFTAEASRDAAIAQKDRPGYLGTLDLTPYGYWDNRRGAYVGSPTFGSGLDASGAPFFSATVPFGSVRPPGNTDPQVRTYLLPCTNTVGSYSHCVDDSYINYFQIQPKTERMNLFGRGAYQFTDNMQGYLELGFFRSQMDAVGTPGAVNDSGVYNSADPYNPIVHTTTLPANHPDNPYGVARTLSLLTDYWVGGRNQSTDNQVTRVVAGLKGTAFDWTYDLGALYVKSKLENNNYGFIRWSVMQAALNAGTLRIDPALNSAELMAQISPVLTTNPTSEVDSLDFNATRELWDLPGGRLGVAVGAEYRKEKTNNPAVPYTDTGDIVGLGYSAFTGDRNVTAGYVEINAPVVSILELNGAFRYDEYSDYGNSSTPKFGFKLTPTPQFSVRGTYSEAFRAPGPAENGNSSSFGFTNISILSIGNPDVKPETAKSYTFGIVAEPIENSSISVDYYHIKRKNEIQQADQTLVLDGIPTNGIPNSTIAGALPNSLVHYDDNGDIAGIAAPYINLSQTNTKGFDVDLRSAWNLAGGSKIEASLLWTHTISFERVLPDGTSYEYAGTHGPFVLSDAGGTPKNRGSLTVTWSKEKLALTGRLNYTGTMKIIDHEGETLEYAETGLDGRDYYVTSTGEGEWYVADPNGIVCAVYRPDGTPAYGDCKLPDYVTVDMNAKWAVNDKLDVVMDIRNALNKMAPLDPYTYGALNYNPSFHQDGAVGRYFTLSAKYRF